MLIAFVLCSCLWNAQWSESEIKYYLGPIYLSTVPPGQPDGRRRVPSHITWHVHNLRTIPAHRPNPDHKTNDTRSMAASVCRLHYWPWPHCSSATLPRFALQLDEPVVVLRNAATVPSGSLSVAVHRVASPPGTPVHHESIPCRRENRIDEFRLGECT